MFSIKINKHGDPTMDPEQTFQDAQKATGVAKKRASDYRLEGADA